MKPQDLRNLLKKAEQELDNPTPGAYCTRKVAVRAMELIIETANKEATQAVAEVITEANKRMEDMQAMLKDSQDTIARQAKALTELQKPKTQPSPYSTPPPLSGLGQAAKERRDRDRKEMELLEAMRRNEPMYPSRQPYKSGYYNGDKNGNDPFYKRMIDDSFKGAREI